MSLHFTVPALQGSLVRLEPLSPSHAADLALAAEEDRAAYGFTWVPRRSEIGDYLRSQFRRAETGKLAPFAQIRLADGRAVGCTAYWNPREWPDRPGPAAIEIGFTWLGASALRTGINLESKLLLLRHAFEQLGVARVDFKTDARNEQCRQALHGLGACFEGLLRSWSRSWAPGEDGLLRDSAMYSVVASEWPSCEKHLLKRLGRAAGHAAGSAVVDRTSLPYSGDVQFRSAGAADATAIAGLHADSWRRHYRPAYADAFLDKEAARYCLSTWTERLSVPRPGDRTIVAERDSELVGFAHTRLDEDPMWGAYIDSLHVVHGLKRQGIGTQLLALTGEAVVSHAPSSGMYLWVLEQNSAARGFYAARGGVYIARDDVPPPGGDPSRLNGKPARLRYAWTNPSKLLSEPRGR